MALIEWSDKLALGYERMDETHRAFVEQLNALDLAPQEAFVDLLDRFIEHTVEHFAQEQRWMRELDFPPIHCHTNEHDGVLNIMRDVRRMVTEGQPEIGRVLTKELAPWFENHAAGMDAMLAFFLRCKAEGIDPMQALAARSQAAGSCATAMSCAESAESADSPAAAKP